MSVYKDEQLVKEKIIDCYHRGTTNHEGVTIPIEKRGKAGKGSHYIALGAITELQKQTTADEMIERMKRRGILAKKKFN
jgi:dTDP-4-amino-4,6-dideoxygalactose transaminase